MMRAKRLLPNPRSGSDLPGGSTVLVWGEGILCQSLPGSSLLTMRTSPPNLSRPSPSHLLNEMIGVKHLASSLANSGHLINVNLQSQSPPPPYTFTVCLAHTSYISTLSLSDTGIPFAHRYASRPLTRTHTLTGAPSSHPYTPSQPTPFFSALNSLPGRLLGRGQET